MFNMFVCKVRKRWTSIGLHGFTSQKTDLFKEISSSLYFFAASDGIPLQDVVRYRPRCVSLPVITFKLSDRFS
jgi:hypothetical protein